MAYYKYSGAGNTFTIVDGREGIPGQDMAGMVDMICTEFTTDGFMILKPSERYDFAMEYYNSDGSGGMMCGNGGRCMAAFADYIGIEPANGESYVFEAPDGVHCAEILSRDGRSRMVRLKMRDVSGIRYYEELSDAPVDGYFLDTGTRHFVVFDDEVDDIAVNAAGSVIRHCREFAPAGTNADFVCPAEGGIKVRTFEKGVEDETFSCGTGVVASAIAAYRQGIRPGSEHGGVVHYDVHVRGGMLAVDFRPSGGLAPLAGASLGSVSSDAVAAPTPAVIGNDNGAYTGKGEGAGICIGEGKGAGADTGDGTCAGGGTGKGKGIGAAAGNADGNGACTGAGTGITGNAAAAGAGAGADAVEAGSSAPIACDVYLTGPAELIYIV